MSSEKDNSKSSSGDVVFVTEFVHWRSGELIVAANYGLKAFPIRIRKKG